MGGQLVSEVFNRVEVRPRALRDRAEILRRRGLLREPHIAQLTDWVAALRAGDPDTEYPDFDPEGGGIEADILFLKEKPGPRTSFRAGGSGFISVNNDDPTAEWSCRFMAQAGILQSRTCSWNIIPGWNGQIAYRSKERREGLPHVLKLLCLLPGLRVVVLVGKVAQRALSKVTLRPDLKVVTSAHPALRVRNANRAAWEQIPVRWAEARAIADSDL